MTPHPPKGEFFYTFYRLDRKDKYYQKFPLGGLGGHWIFSHTNFSKKNTAIAEKKPAIASTA